MKTVATEALLCPRSELGNKDGHLGVTFSEKGFFSWFLVTDFIPNCKMKQNIHRWLSHQLLGRCSQKERFMISYFTFCCSLSPHFGLRRREASWRVWKRALYTPQLPHATACQGLLEPESSLLSHVWYFIKWGNGRSWTRDRSPDASATLGWRDAIPVLMVRISGFPPDKLAKTTHANFRHSYICLLFLLSSHPH